MADVAVDLTAEVGIAEAQTQAVLGQLVQQLRRGDPAQIGRVEAKALDDRVSQRRGLLADDPAELGCDRPLLIAPEGVLKQRREHPSGEQRPTDLADRQQRQPLPLRWQTNPSEPCAEHHRHNPGQRQRHRQQRRLYFAQAIRCGM